jgi:hypothetical protein
VKAGGRVDHRWLVLQLGTACQLDLFESFDGGEMLVDENGIGQGPQVLRRLLVTGVLDPLAANISQCCARYAGRCRVSIERVY